MDCSAIMRNYSRYLLVIFNFIFAVTGAIIISVGISAKAYFHEFDNFLDNKYFYVSDFLIVIGVVIFFIAFFGCCGAIKENACMTTTFSTLLIVIFVLEVVAAVCGILLKSRTEKYLVNTLDDTIKRYNSSNTEIEVIWDRVQREFNCCGVLNASDWRNHTEGLPLSCCSIPTGASGNFSCTESNAYQVGCLQEFGGFIRSHTTIIEGVGIAMAIIQLLGIVLSCYLAKSIRSDYETV